MKIARIFPRKTNATPVDELAFYDTPGLFIPEVEEIHISVTFTYDMKRAEYLAKEWSHVAHVKIGGPATGMLGDQFEPGMYLKPGYIITSRGCPECCWFCEVWRRQLSCHMKGVKELEIKDGWNVLDDNILACSESHIYNVFEMLKKQPKRARFTGGLDAARLKTWHVELLRNLRPEQMYFSYDTIDDYEPLLIAGKMLWEYGFKRGNHNIGCYVLVGYPMDTFEKAENRIRQVIQAGFFPFAMLYRDKEGITSNDWRKFQRCWTRPQIVASKIKVGI